MRKFAQKRKINYVT